VIELPPSPTDNKWQTYVQRLSRYLVRTKDKLTQKTQDEVASDDGVILWDRENKYPVVSRDGVYKQIILEDGHAYLSRSTNVTAASANTAYAIQYDSPSDAVGISLDGTDATKIVFAEAGEYLLNFSAQMSTSTSSSVNFYFWARINGTDVPKSTMFNSLKQNSTTLVVSKSAIFEIEANDYLQAMWAVDDTTGILDATAATAFAPAAPATTLSIARIHG
jgi:hypothetical protein